MTHSEASRLCDRRGDVLAWSTVSGETERAEGATKRVAEHAAAAALLKRLET